MIRGSGVFLDAHRIEVQHLDGSRRVLQAPRMLLATGSRPRHVSGIEVDHEHIVDSDSILSLPYIPRSMLVLGSGVIACEYASIFAALGCAVTMLDKAAEPLGFLDPALRAGFLAAFRAMGGEYRGGTEVGGARFDGFSQVEVQLRGGEILAADIVFAAFGRVANLEGIGLDRLGLGISSRGTVQVNERFETNIPGIFAAGDAIGPPALACAAADQGRRAALAALGLPPPALTAAWCRAASTPFRRSLASDCRRARRRRRKSTSSSAAPISAKWRARISPASPMDFSRCYASAAARGSWASRCWARARPNSFIWGKRPSPPAPPPISSSNRSSISRP